MISQGDTLLAGSIFDNISFFDPEANMERVHHSASLAKVHNDILDMPMKYETFIGDMGSSLSAGQIQRVLIARALYKKASLIMLDEGTANLDRAIEKEIIQNIINQDAAIFIISHNISIFHLLDTIYKMEDGKISKDRSFTA